MGLFDGGSFSKGSQSSSAWLKRQQQAFALEQDRQMKLTALKGSQPQEAAAAPPESGNIFRRAPGAIGNFLKNSALDLKNVTLDTAKGVATMAESPFKESHANSLTDQALAAQRQYHELTKDWTPADYNDPNKKAQADQLISHARALTTAAQGITSGDNIKNLDAKKLAAQAGETAINVGTLGLGDLVTIPGKAIAKQVGKEVFKTGGADLARTYFEHAAARQAEQVAARVAQSGAKKLAGNIAKDAVVGGAFGATSAVAQDPNASAGDIAKNGTIGAFLGGAMPAAGALIKKAIRPLVTTAKAGVKTAQPAAQEVASSVLHIPGENGGVYAKISPDQLAHLKDENANIPWSATDRPHLTPLGKTGDAKEVSLDELMNRSPNVKAAIEGVPRQPADVNKMLNDAAKAAVDKHEQGFLGKIADAIGQHANPLGVFREIDQKAADRMGLEYKDLPASSSLEHNIQMRENADNIVHTLADHKTVTGDSFQDLAKKYSNKDAAAEFNNYTTAKYDLDRRATGRTAILSDTKAEDLQKFVSEYEAKNPNALKDLQTKNEFYGKAADELHAGGLLSDAEHKRITESSDKATPLNRIFADAEALDSKVMPGRRAGSIAKQSVIKELKGGTEPIDNSFDVTIQRVHKAVSQRIDNNIANILRHAAEHGDVQGRVFQEAGAKEAKAAARSERILTNKIARKLEKKMALSNRQAKKLGTELNNLNKEGLAVATKQREKVEPKRAIKTVTVKTVHEQIKEHAPKTIDELVQPLHIRQMLAREYGEGAEGMAQMAADIYNGGWNQLIELGPKMNRNTAKSIAGQVLKKPTVKGAVTTVTEGYAQHGATTRQLIESLINKTPAELVKIQKKIAVREPKLAAKLDKIMEQQQVIESHRAMAMSLKKIEVGLTREDTTGKAYINGVQDGMTFRVELPPRVINSLDKMSRTEVNAALKIAGVVNQVFRIAWVGALAPGFAVKSALWDTTMGIVNSSDGFKTVAPKAVIASIKALRESDDFVQKLRAHGASTVGSSKLGIHARVSHESLAATKSIFSRVKFAAKNPEAAIDSLDVFGGKMASLTRTRVARAAYDRALKSGMNEKEALSTAAYMYNNVMPDFATMSPLVRQINTVIPFFNASIAGTRSMAQAFKRSPKATTAKMAALGVTPALAVAAYSLGSDSGRKFYQDMHDSGNDSVLNNNLVIVLPGAHKDDATGEWTGIMKFPMIPEFRNINSQAWRSMEALHGGKGTNPQQTAMDMFDTITGSVRTLSNPMVDIKTILDGKDPNTKKDLIAGNLKDLPQNEQAYDTTSNAGRAVGKVLHTSPIQGDKIVGTFGTTGSAIKKGNATRAVAENTVNTYSGAHGQKAASAFYDTYSPLKAENAKVSKQVTQLVVEGKTGQAKRVADEYNNSLKGKFGSFSQEYGKSPAYGQNWDDLMTGLYISTGEKSLAARVK